VSAWATLLVALPFALVVATTFVKFSLVLAILGRGFGGGLPPAAVSATLALLFALFVTAPVTTRAWEATTQAGAKKGDAAAAQAAAGAIEPVRAFLAKHAPARERQSFLELQRQLRPPAERAGVGENDLVVLAAAFVTAELKAAFEIGFLLFLPFLVIELVTAMVLTSVGMNTVAPELVALPFKLLLFVVADGWHLLFRGLVLGYT
jgi:type III secretion protein R